MKLTRLLLFTGEKKDCESDQLIWKEKPIFARIFVSVGTQNILKISLFLIIRVS